MSKQRDPSGSPKKAAKPAKKALKRTKTAAQDWLAGRDERIEFYRSQSRQIDDQYFSGGQKSELRVLLEQLKTQAEQSGDLDYSFYFEYRLQFYQENFTDLAYCTQLLEKATEWQQSKNLPEDYLLLRAKGMTAFYQSDLDRAIEIFDAALAIKPDDYVTLRCKGISYGQKDDFERSIEIFDAALAIKPDDYVTLGLKGISYSNIGEEDRAIESYDIALAIKPNDFSALRQKGISYFNKGDFDRAIEFYDEALKINPRDYVALRQKGVAYFQKGEADRAIELYDKALEINPEDFEALRCKGVAYSNKGEADRAIEFYDKALEINPEDSEALRCKGVAYSNKGEADRAIELYDKALEINPEDSEALRYKGEAYSNKGEFDLAIKLYDEALRLNPKDSEALRQRREIYFNKGDFNWVIEFYDKALAINPKDSEALRYKGEAYSNKGEFDLAIKLYDEAIEINPEDSEALRCRGEACSNKGDEDEAIEFYNKALAINPEDSEALRCKGVTYSKKGNEDWAIEFYDEALKLNPKDYRTIQSKGISYAKKGYEDKAIEFFDEALKLNPNDYRTLRSKGVSYAKKGYSKDTIELHEEAIKFYTEALKLFEKALELNPNDYYTLREKARVYFKMGEVYSKKRDHKKAALQIEEALNNLKEANNLSKDRFAAELSLMHRRTSEKQSQEDLEKFEGYLKLKKNAEDQLEKKLQRSSQFDHNSSFFLFLRRWNSFTPAIPTHSEESVGGGYFLWHEGEGTVIDPGYKFIENFHRAGGSLSDIHNIVITHSHDDHTHQLEQLCTLLYEYNELIKSKNKKLVADIDKLSRKAKELLDEKKYPEYLIKQKELDEDLKELRKKKKKVKFYLSNATFNKFSGILDLEDFSYIEHIYTLNPDTEFQIKGGILKVLTAYHKEIRAVDQAVGLLFKLDKEDFDEPHRILLTSDTGIFPVDCEQKGKPTLSTKKASMLPDIYKYSHGIKEDTIDLMILHIGSIKETEKGLISKYYFINEDERKKQLITACYRNHLGFLGVQEMIRSIKPKLAVISEWGEEMRDFRENLTEQLQAAAYGTKVLPSDIPLVYGIFTNEKNQGMVWDCLYKKWAKAQEIKFITDESSSEKMIYYTENLDDFKKDKVEFQDCVKYFSYKRELREGMYFIKEKEDKKSKLPAH